jgi:hypothetical protein
MMKLIYTDLKISVNHEHQLNLRAIQKINRTQIIMMKLIYTDLKISVNHEHQLNLRAILS